MLKAAQVGLGWWGSQVTKVLRGSEKLEILYGIDPDPEIAGKYEADYGLKVVSDYQQALDDILGEGDYEGLQASLEEAAENAETIDALGDKQEDLELQAEGELADARAPQNSEPLSDEALEYFHSHLPGEDELPLHEEADLPIADEQSSEDDFESDADESKLPQLAATC